jgi:hypothetical protein
MIWQFGEYGYDYSIDYNGRTGEKPVRWDYLNIPGRKDLYRFYGALNALRMQNERLIPKISIWMLQGM